MKLCKQPRRCDECGGEVQVLVQLGDFAQETEGDNATSSICFSCLQAAVFLIAHPGHGSINGRVE